MKRYVSSLGLAYRPGMALAMVLGVLALALQLALPAALIDEAEARADMASPWSEASLCLAHDEDGTPPLPGEDARHAALHHGLCLLCQASAGAPLLTTLAAPALLPPGENYEVPIHAAAIALHTALRPRGSARGPPERGLRLA